MFFFTADEHYGHRNIITYCNRPFPDVEEMDEEIIKRHNTLVKQKDTVVHGGDFSLLNSAEDVYRKYINRLNGKHIFMVGSHDRWLKGNVRAKHIWEKKIQDQYVVVCHYAMKVWPRSHYGAWQLYGHSHGKLLPQDRQWDIGVDNNDFYPVSFDEINEIMRKKEYGNEI